MLIIISLILLSLILDSRKNNNRLSDNLHAQTLQTTIWEDKYGRSHAEIEHLRFTNRELREAMPILIDSIKKDFTKIKPKTITKVVTINTETTDTVYFDTSNPTGFHYKDKWTDIQVRDDNTLTYLNRDSIAMVDSKKKYGFLNLKSKYTIEAVSYNPNTKFTGVKSIDIIPDPKRVGIGVMAGYGMSNKGLSPFIGVGVYYSIFP